MISPVLPTYNRAPIALVRGSGARAYTDDGTEYLDFGAGVAVNSCGHAHPHLVAALTEQAGKIWHTSNLYQMPGQEKLARRLIDNSFADTVFFCNSGAEANELAIKMARKYHAAKGQPERFHIITFEGAFHGRTTATLAAGGQEKYLEGFGPKAPGFDQVKVGDHKALEALIGPQTAAIMIEPIQGEGGISVIAPEELRYLRKLCDEHGMLLVFDEIQTGTGRTGKLFAHEWAGVTPDIMAIAKGIGGGFPLGACLATEAAAAGMVAGTHGSTFGGNPLATAVGNAVLDVVLEVGFLANVQKQALKLKQSLERLKDTHPDVIAEIRGSGLMMGIKTKVPNTEFIKAALDQKLLTIGAGDNVVRLLPPLIVNDADVAEAVAKLEKACAHFEKK
ncbi:aspartate aminotransferase family protein [Aestuariivirga litoralis]|uniref:aspartate aminotransferase family protein n=1 Tax=Aestuariivirga litoralis TaxID=2650924 RepID=UPI0018C6F19E|nr:aspartate aminotransferase family protein [Aestuariivirga litoralis]MBG1232845.1 aspartate aminotransferase family protein [Aestuariivirga litoralis]